jgi:hemerythrin superfamily protein
MDAFELLKTDHEKVSQLFEEIESASGQRKRQVFNRLKAELDVHAHIEEKILYPALENTDEAREITLEAYEEHKVVKDLLAELAKGGAPNDEWDAKLTVLKENVEHHVEEEEGELFSKARKALSSKEIDRIGAELEGEKARKQGASVTTRGAKSRARKAPAGPSRPASPPSSKKASKETKESESPGVLKRIANFIGLGDASAADSKKTKKAGKASRTSKTSGTTRTSASSKSSKGKAGKPAVKSAQKSAGKKSATRAKSAGKKSAASKRSAATKTSAGRANKRVPVSRKGVSSTKSAASRSASKKK